jgi:hypothetical protein
MIISNKFNGYVAGRRTYHTGMEPILIGAALGGGASALQGGDPIKGALMGGVTGGIGSAASAALPSLLGSNAATTAATAAAPSALNAASVAPSALSSAASSPISALASGPGDWLGAFGDLAGAQGVAPVAQQAANPFSMLGQEAPGFKAGLLSAPPPSSGMGLMDIWSKLSPEKKMLYGGVGGLGLLSALQRNKVPGQTPYSGQLSKFNYDPSRYTPQFAEGGIAEFAKGGIADLGSYSDGGRLLKGPGDGMSDNIPATIAQKQPARLADGEFVVPADVVSHLGNGSTDAGAKQLYAMMDRIRSARTGRKKQGRKINPKKLMPA